MVTYKLTIDINLLDVDPKVPAITTLKRWKEEGKIDLIEAEGNNVKRPQAYGWPGAPPKPVEENRGRGNLRVRPKKDSASGPNFKNVAAVLFPHKDSQKLNMSEINDVAHLIKHHDSKNEIFVTKNNKDFIDEGRRELLRSYFGVVAMTPEEAVDMLSKTEGWK
jgi:hypothetical protein